MNMATIRNYEKEIPSNMTSSVYFTRDGVFLDMSQGGSGTTIQVIIHFIHNLEIQLFLMEQTQELEI